MIKSKIFLVILCTLITSLGYSAEEIYSVRRDSSTVFSNDFNMVVVDGRFDELGLGNFVDREPQLLVKFGVSDRSYFSYITAYTSLTLNVSIQAYNELDLPVGAPENTALTISYSPASDLKTVEMAYFKTSGAHKYVISVEELAGTIPENIYVEAELSIDRYYEISTTAPSVGTNYVFYTGFTENVIPINDFSVIPIDGQELEVRWDYVLGAEEYELEWKWINNYGETTVGGTLGASAVDLTNRDFELGSTRIITKEQRYRIPLIYNKGFLVYRVRGIGRWVDNNLDDVHILKYGPWSSGTSTKTNVSHWPNYVELSTVHEALKNWQYQAVYAEDGKKKEIISYFDGSLRNRQTVTRINSNHQTIVGENVYDNQGRSAVQILPTPVANAALGYYPKLNVNMYGDPYSHLDFDWEDTTSSTCIVNSYEMDSTTGASKYYSTQNSATGNWQDYVPLANGYPFVQVEYTPDNTGRVRAQSGVGSTYKLAGAHATKYFYIQPTQEELNRLFGYEVGFKTRYKKNLVVDANNQVSISYIDPQGRVIATALAGTNSVDDDSTTTNLYSLAEELNGNHGYITSDLLSKYDPDDANTEWDDNKLFASGNNGPLHDALILNTQWPCVENNSPHAFEYTVKTSTFSDTCTGAVAYPFAYSLQIDVTNDCGESMITTTGAINEPIAGTNPGGDYLSTVTANEVFNFNATLQTGSYTVKKVILLNQDSLESHLTHYLANNACMLAPGAFFENTVDCFDEYPESSVLDSISFTSCLVTREMMLADLNPGAQYGSTAAADLTSIFSFINVLPNGAFPTIPLPLPLWKNPSTPYLDFYGNISYIPVNQVSPGVFDPALDAGLFAGDLVPSTVSGQWLALPEQLLNVTDFIGKWNPSWAESLIENHPEFCYLAYLDTLCLREYTNGGGSMSTETYDQYLRSIDTYAEAKSGNLFSSDLTDAIEIFDQDPYFHLNYTTIPDNALKADLMEYLMGDYKGSTITLWEYAIQSVICGSTLTGTCTIPASILADLNDSTDINLTDNQQNQIWKIYRETYIAEKKKINQIFMDLYAIDSDCYNGFIGEETPTTPSVLAFSYYPDYLALGYIGGSNTILSLYVDAIFNSGMTTDPFPWAANPFSGVFATKEKRVIPIDNLYDSSVPEEITIQEMQNQVDAENYAQTGRCDLSFDVEYFLDALAKNNQLDSSGMSSDFLPQLTNDLFLEMGGTIPAANAVTINTATDVVNDLKEIGVSVGMTPFLCSSSTPLITLSAPTGLDWVDYLTTWTITEMSMLYYVPGSYNSFTGKYNFQILVKVDVSGTITEYVLDGVTCINIGECYYNSNECKRGQTFGDELAAIFAVVYDDVLIAENLTDYVGGWYTSSELLGVLDDNPASPTALITCDATSEFKIFIGLTSITVDFTSPYDPDDIVSIMGATYNESTQVLTIYYIDDNGVTQTLDGVISDDEFSFACGCPAEEKDLALSFENLVNYLLIDHNDGGITYPMPFFDELDIFKKYLSIVLPVVTDFSSEDGELAIELNEGECNPTLISDDAFDFEDLVSINSVEVEIDPITAAVSFTALGVLEDGTIVHLATKEDLNCFERITCNSCVTQTVAPLSCNEMWTIYNDTLSDLNGNISGDEDLFPILEEEDFCETNLAYIVLDYLHYLETFGIENSDDDKYISIELFGNTNLNYGYDASDMSSQNVIVDEYFEYQTTDSIITWGSFVNLIYLGDTTICPPAPMLSPLNGTFEYPCEQLTANIDTVNAANQYNIYLNNMAENFRQRYVEQSMDSLVETFDISYNDKEFHYTLYYYDQAGNLTQTVPPKGVDRIDQTVNKTAVHDARINNSHPSNGMTHDVLPEHTYTTNYLYNSLNQLVHQSTPDGGESDFAYDSLGRLTVSQNAKQKAYPVSGKEQFSYTKYDPLGRIIEVGEVELNDTYGFNENGKFVNGAGSVINVSHPSFPQNIGGIKEEVTITLYDEVLSSTVQNLFEDYAEFNTRNRITGVLYFESYDNMTDIETEYNNGTFYDYDVHGNVKEVIQDIKDEGLIALGQNIKKTKYEYDLVSGNVKEVAYQKDEADQFKHRYDYDDDNRITLVETSNDDVVWEQDAKYFYYEHGPLARTEIGNKKVQSNDYAYTVQGWLKGVNSEDLSYDNDQGKDAQDGSINSMNAKDVYGFSLHYFSGDYQARQGNDFLTYSSTATPYSSIYNLYNGNIKEMYTTISDLDEASLDANHTWYRYDQLNRIKSMNSELVTSTSSADAGFYESKYWYDSNGNLDSLVRWAKVSAAKTIIDNFKYHYQNVGGNPSNQLEYVSDDAGLVASTDLDDQSAGNYTYDEIGQLITDDQEQIDTIYWKVTGKVKRITRPSGSTKEEIEFTYDAMGNRIIKAVYENSGDLISKTYYFNDAQGNVMSIYTLKEESSDTNLYLSERNIYGSSRVGIEKIIAQVIASSDTLNINIDNELHQNVGDKLYELSNHLGNVLNVISDRKLPMNDGMGGVEYYTADVQSFSDYYPFGMVMPGRNGGENYRFSFQGQEGDSEIKGEGNSINYKYRMHDPRIGRFFAVDPLTAQYPHYSPYSFSGNRVIDMIELEGLEPIDPRTGKKLSIDYNYGDGVVWYNPWLVSPLGWDTDWLIEIDQNLGEEYDGNTYGAHFNGPDGSFASTTGESQNLANGILKGGRIPQYNEPRPSEMIGGAKSGNYILVKSMLAEHRVFGINNLSYNVYYVSGGIIRQELIFTRPEGSGDNDMFQLTTVKDFHVSESLVTTEVNFQGKTFEVTTLVRNTTETIQNYENEKPVGEVTVKTYETKQIQTVVEKK